MILKLDSQLIEYYKRKFFMEKSQGKCAPKAGP